MYITRFPPTVRYGIVFIFPIKKITNIFTVVSLDSYVEIMKSCNQILIWLFLSYISSRPKKVEEGRRVTHTFPWGEARSLQMRGGEFKLLEI